MSLILLFMACETTTVIGTDRCDIDISSVEAFSRETETSNSSEDSDEDSQQSELTTDDDDPQDGQEQSGLEEQLLINGYPFGKAWDMSVLINDTESSVLEKTETNCDECVECRTANLCGQCSDCESCSTECLECQHSLLVAIPSESLNWGTEPTNYLQVFGRLGHSDSISFELSSQED